MYLCIVMFWGVISNSRDRNHLAKIKISIKKQQQQKQQNGRRNN